MSPAWRRRSGLVMAACFLAECFFILVKLPVYLDHVWVQAAAGIVLALVTRRLYREWIAHG